MYVGNGFSTNVRAWVRPDIAGTSLRSLVCKNSNFREAVKFKLTFG